MPRSPLRDLAKTPDDPGVHLHRGAAGETSRYFHGLQVKLNADGRSGNFFGSVTRTDEQVKALLSAQTDVDIHTGKNGSGEVRDQWRPLDVRGAALLLATLDRREPDHARPASGGSCH